MLEIIPKAAMISFSPPINGISVSWCYFTLGLQCLELTLAEIYSGLEVFAI